MHSELLINFIVHYEYVMKDCKGLTNLVWSFLLHIFWEKELSLKSTKKLFELSVSGVLTAINHPSEKHRFSQV